MLRGITTPTELGFLTSCPKAVQDSDHSKMFQKASCPPTSGVMLSPGKDLKFNQKRRGAWPEPREDKGVRKVFHVVKGLRAQPQRIDLARKLPSALEREHLVAFMLPRMFWHNYWTYPQDLEGYCSRSFEITNDQHIATSIK